MNLLLKLFIEDEYLGKEKGKQLQGKELNVKGKQLKVIDNRKTVKGKRKTSFNGKSYS